MNNTIDQAQAVRDEDALDIQSLTVYLIENFDSFNVNDKLTIQQFSGGASNLTYQLSWAGKQLILRTSPPAVNIKSAHDMGREYKVLTLLAPHFKYAPQAVLMCEDCQIIGRPFYLMQKVEGIIPRKTFPMPVSASQAKSLCQQLLDVHITLHEIDIEQTNLIQLGKPDGYIKRQVLGWNKRYKNALIQGSLPANNLMLWLEQNMPDDEQSCLIHNDYKFDNVVLSADDPSKIIAVLDWEMTTIGSPLMDLGCSLAYWIEKNDPPAMQAIRMMPTHIDGMMTRDEIIAYYGDKRKINMAAFNYFYVFGLFRLAVIVQQIYKRYAQGKTSNPAFAKFGQLVKVLIMQAENHI
jgi:aminoglycoside phosphotransferase (APT) family kinase protein